MPYVHRMTSKNILIQIFIRYGDIVELIKSHRGRARRIQKLVGYVGILAAGRSHEDSRRAEGVSIVGLSGVRIRRQRASI